MLPFACWAGPGGGAGLGRPVHRLRPARASGRHLLPSSAGAASAASDAGGGPPAHQPALLPASFCTVSKPLTPCCLQAWMTMCLTTPVRLLGCLPAVLPPCCCRPCLCILLVLGGVLCLAACSACCIAASRLRRFPPLQATAMTLTLCERLAAGRQATILVSSQWQRWAGSSRGSSLPSSSGGGSWRRSRLGSGLRHQPPFLPCKTHTHTHTHTHTQPACRADQGP